MDLAVHVLLTWPTSNVNEYVTQCRGLLAVLITSMYKYSSEDFCFLECEVMQSGTYYQHFVGNCCPHPQGNEKLKHVNKWYGYRERKLGPGP